MPFGFFVMRLYHQIINIFCPRYPRPIAFGIWRPKVDRACLLYGKDQRASILWKMYNPNVIWNKWKTNLL